MSSLAVSACPAFRLSCQPSVGSSGQEGSQGAHWSLGPWALESEQIQNPATPFLNCITLSKETVPPQILVSHLETWGNNIPLL